MPPLKYHSGQIAVQEEAKTTSIAERLAYWVGPAAEFAQGADLILLAMAEPDRTLNFTALSGAPPLVEIGSEAPASVRFRRGEPAAESNLRIRFRLPASPIVDRPTPCGALAMNLAERRRVRINGILKPVPEGSELVCTETFSLCRKYIAPSLAEGDKPHRGPVDRVPLALGDPWPALVLSRAETAFLVSISPDGEPDISHRGGPAGFLELDAAARKLQWSEFVGDGVFKSAGNIRENGIMSLLVPDLESGDGVLAIGRATYQNLRSARSERLSPLEQHHDAFPVQGTMTCNIERVFQLRELMIARRRVGQAAVTSRSTPDEQAPQ